MNLHDLHDAFAELERRADGLPHEPFVPPAPQRSRVLLVGASAAAVVAVAGGTAWLSSGTSDHDGQQVGSSGSPTVTGSQGYSPLDNQTSSAPTAPSSPPSSAPSSAPSSVVATKKPVADTEADIAVRFRSALDGLASSFTVVDSGHAVTVRVPGSTTDLGLSTAPADTAPGSSGVAIVGQLVSASGVSGGYDVQMWQGHAGQPAVCEDSDIAQCSVTPVAGGSLALGHEQLQTGGGVTYQGEFVRADGVTILLHVSNRADPKGGGGVLASAPPLTDAQVRQVVTSSAW